MDVARPWKRYALRAAPLVALFVIFVAINPSLFSLYSSSINNLQLFRSKSTERTASSSKCECNLQNPVKKVAIVGQSYPSPVNRAKIAL